MTDTAMSRWLREEMPKRNYPLEGPRAGGISRLGHDTGISQAAMSRLVNGQQEPTVVMLRKIGNLFGVPLGEMMIVAGLAERDELAHFGAAHLTAGSSMTVDENGVTVTPAAANLDEPPADLPGHVLWAGLSTWEKEIWLLKGFSVDERRGMIFYVLASRQDEASQRQIAAPESRDQTG